MAKFDKYVLSQLLTLFGFFSLVLVLVYWVNRAVVLFDQLIANGHSAMVFLEFTALTLPNVIRLVMPVASFAAVVYCTNRLASDSELVVVQATGYSPFRMARPVVYFGVIVGIMLSVLTHVLVPASIGQLDVRRAELEQDMTARFLREGTFLHPARGITLYIREITAAGELRDVFLTDGRAEDTRTNYTARKAVFARTQNGPQLIMFDGLAQVFDETSRNLSTTTFTDFVFDIAALLNGSKLKKTDPRALPTSALLWPDRKTVRKTHTKRPALIQAGHERISQAFLSAAAGLIGFSALLIGGFSRFGLWRQIALAVFSIILLKLFDNFMNDMARSNVQNWPLVYAAPVLGFAFSGLLLWISSRPALFSSRNKAQPA